MDNKELLIIAKKAKNYAYSPYSKFQVGAALLTKDDKIFMGCNVENSSYGATCCAERTAIYKAISEGSSKFEKIAVVSTSEDSTYPCGICRQVLMEFMPEGEIILENALGEIHTYKVADLLPHSFSLEV
ncbi:MAG: cytidine deaminase [Lachnospirales bacterium]